MPELSHSIGSRYIQDTKFNRQSIFDQQRPRVSGTEQYKHYAAAEKIDLPAVEKQTECDFWHLLGNRRSVRRYSSAGISQEELAALCYAAQGITAKAGPHLLRTAPSAGALYPVETYIGIERVNGIEPGLYHYEVDDGQLARLDSGPPGRDLAAAALDQAFVAKGAVVFVWSAIFRRNMSKYGHRGMRYILMDAAHICQNLLLAAAALGLSACPVAAFFDDEMNRLLGLDGEEESVIYLAVVGPRA